MLAAAFQVPAVVIIKHAIPSGVAVGASLSEAFSQALACDPAAAFGGVIAVNRPVSADLAAAMTERKLDVLFAPGLRGRGTGGAAAQGEPAHP